MASLITSSQLDGSDSSSDDEEYIVASDPPPSMEVQNRAAFLIQKAHSNRKVPVESKRLKRLRRRCLVVQSYVRRFLAKKAFNATLIRVVSCQRLWRHYRRGVRWSRKGDIQQIKIQKAMLQRKRELLEEEGLRYACPLPNRAPWPSPL